MSKNLELMQELETDSWQGRTTNTVLAENAEIAARAGDSISAGDEILRLVQRVFLTQTEQSPQVVVFAGVNHGEGCSRICASAAEVLARSVTGSVCLVDANFRSPALPALFHTSNHHGLTNSLLADGPIRTFAKPLTGDKKLWLLSSGALDGGSANLLSCERLRARIDELRREFQFVVIDAAPLTPYGDAITLGALTDGLVMILEAESTRREPALMAADALRTARIPILAAVLNNRTFPIPRIVYSRL